MTRQEALNFRHKIESVAKKLDDTEALDAIELFPQWKENIFVTLDERYRFKGELYKVTQSHQTQTDWTPDIATSLFVKVQADIEQGTIDNPIPYSLNMELIQGKYYIENDVKYLCTRDLAASYWPLSQLVGQYVEII